ncbi:DUF2190 family protein [Salmonella enterica]|nr:DUF2190 family protein [Salmonella enterica]ECI4259837.1 recombinase RecA [Salmonella enterica subsp. salamae]EDG9405759.1 DUF2190 family protein [Salmonella enterica subsp. enterica serovar Tennessee]EDT1794782.1 DUF2190 family protein [Salmonella enterica subsp. enterica]EHN2045984.1 DUF2190 family protein [Salmonella enterica subsp. enterica serovar Nima]
MAKNYVEDGKTIEIVATTSLKSGDLVQVGDMFAVAVTDITAGSAGTGIAEGVFSVPKLATEDIASGKKVYLKDGAVQTDATGGLPFVGVAWASAANGDESVPVKLNG